MPHQELYSSPRPRKLAQILDIPYPQAIGHIVLIWDRGWDCDDLELSAEWDGEPGALQKALLAVGLLEKADDDEVKLSKRAFELLQEDR